MSTIHLHLLRVRPGFPSCSLSSPCFLRRCDTLLCRAFLRTHDHGFESLPPNSEPLSTSLQSIAIGQSQRSAKPEVE